MHRNRLRHYFLWLYLKVLVSIYHIGSIVLHFRHCLLFDYNRVLLIQVLIVSYNRLIKKNESSPRPHRQFRVPQRRQVLFSYPPKVLHETCWLPPFRLLHHILLFPHVSADFCLICVSRYLVNTPKAERSIVRELALAFVSSLLTGFGLVFFTMWTGNYL